MKILKRFLAVFLTAIILCGGFAPAADAFAATTTYSLGKAFTVKYGKTVTIPKELSIKFYESRLWDTQEVSFDLEIVDKKKVTHYETLVYTPVGNPWGNIVFCGDYRIEVKSAAHKKSVKLLVTKPKQRKSSVMNGSADEFYTTKDNEYFEEERFVLYVPKGITLRQDTLVMINEVLDLLEEKTGWKFFAAPIYGQQYAIGPNGGYGYDDNYYFYVDREGKKIQISVVEDFDNAGYISWSSDNSFCYVYDASWEKGCLSVNTVAHELAHVLNFYNLPMAEDSDTFTEGFANALAYEITEELMDKYPMYSINYVICPDVEENPDGSPSPITKSTAQSLFEHNYRIDFEERMQQRNYQIGGALNIYILEKYGADGYVKLKKNFKKKGFVVKTSNEKWNDPDYKDPTIRQYSSALKAVFGKSFFKDFAVWFKANKERLLKNW